MRFTYMNARPRHSHKSCFALLGGLLLLTVACSDDSAGKVADASIVEIDAAPDLAPALPDLSPAPPDRGPAPIDVAFAPDGSAALEVLASPDVIVGEVALDSSLADAEPTEAGRDSGSAQARPFTIAVIPDTQNSHYHSPAFFSAETQWIAKNYLQENIAFVLHEGDIVDGAADNKQWTAAQAAMGLLDGKVPYVLAVGNHDLGAVSGAPRSTLVNQYFPFPSLAADSRFGGAFETGHRENAYYLFPAGDRSWLVVALEFSPRPEVLAWADRILTEHPTLPAIVVTHAYLYSDGNRYNLNGRVCQFVGDCTSLVPAGSNPQCWNPVCYLGDGSDGETIWNSLIKPHSNVLFVFSGHSANAAPFDAARLSSVRSDGTVCHQIMADYQSDGTTGGDGYFRLVRIWPNGRVQVSTFSPYVESARAYLTEDRDQFELQIELPNP